MPNWKKIALSGSSPEFSSLTVDGAIEASKFSGSFSGSIQGDGSELTGLSLPQVATVSDTFTSATSKTVTHNFSTKNVIVQVYDNDDNIIIPQQVTTTDTNTVDITLDTSTTGRVVVAKGGHIVSGSVDFDNLSNKPTLVSSSAQITGFGFISQSSDGAISSSAQIGALGANIVSSSAQIADEISGSGNIRFEALNTQTGSIATEQATQDTRLNTIEAATSSYAVKTDVSGSGNVRFEALNAATSSYAIKTDISGSGNVRFEALNTKTGSIETDITALESFSSSLSTTANTYSGSFSGSFVGDGSNLSGVTSYTDSDNTDHLNTLGVVSSSAQITVFGFISQSSDGAISSSAQIAALGADILSGSGTLFSQSFSSVTAVTASHNFGTKDVVVSTYDNNDNLFFPTNIKTFDTNNVHISFNVARTGRVVVSKGGHVLQSAANAATASYIQGGNVDGTVPSASFAITAGSSTSASFASTGPFLSNTGGTVDGDVVITGNITANEYILSSSVTVVTSSFSSGSTIFGDSIDDTHLFTGSLNVTGSANLVASQSVNTRDDSSLSFWAGTQAQYDALGSYSSNTIYYVT